jgi:hypothetical protein
MQQRQSLQQAPTSFLPLDGPPCFSSLPLHTHSIHECASRDRHITPNHTPTTAITPMARPYSLDHARELALCAAQHLLQQASVGYQRGSELWVKHKPTTTLGWTVSAHQLTACFSFVVGDSPHTSCCAECRMHCVLPSSPLGTQRQRLMTNGGAPGWCPMPCAFPAQTFAGLALVAVGAVSAALVALSGLLLGLCWAGIVLYTFLGERVASLQWREDQRTAAARHGPNFTGGVGTHRGRRTEAWPHSR